MARITPDVPQRGASQNLLRVIDNYYRPARDVVGERAMSEGFSAVSGFFANEARKAKEQQLQEIALKGQADATAGLDPDAELSAVRNGLLFRSNSRAYNQAYNETMGRKAAIEFKDTATLDYERSGMKYSTDPNRFREWMNERVHGFLTDEAHNNPYFLAGAMPYIEQTTFNMSAAHMSNISAQMERNHLAAIQKQADDEILKITTGEATIEEVIGKLSGLNGQAYGTGLSGPRARAALLSSYLSVADATNNIEMIQALLDARESGDLRLTPKEWNDLVNQGESIERDINFRIEQQNRAATAQKEAEISSFEELVTDFYNNPANAGASFQQFLQTPISDGGPTIAEQINASSNSTDILSAAKKAYETVNTIYEVPKGQELGNNLAISSAFEDGTIKDIGSLLSFMSKANSDGFRFNDANWTHAYSELEKRTGPDAPYNSQTYKDYRRSTLNRAIAALTATEEGGLAISSLTGEYSGSMADDITIRFQSYLDENLAATPNPSPAAIREAISKAEEQVMDFYKQNDPDLFNQQFERFQKGVDEGRISWTSNEYFAREAARLAEEQLAADALEAQRIVENRANGFTEQGEVRDDLKLQAANDLLFESSESERVPTVISPAQQAAVDAAAAAEAEQAQRDAQAQIEADALAAQQEADRQAAIAADQQMISDVGAALSALTDINLSDEQFDTILTDLQERFNLTVPTNYDEVDFLIQDLAAAQEESGISLDQEMMSKLIAAALRQSRLK